MRQFSFLLGILSSVQSLQSDSLRSSLRKLLLFLFPLLSPPFRYWPYASSSTSGVFTFFATLLSTMYLPLCYSPLSFSSSQLSRFTVYCSVVFLLIPNETALKPVFLSLLLNYFTDETKNCKRGNPDFPCNIVSQVGFLKISGNNTFHGCMICSLLMCAQYNLSIISF